MSNRIISVICLLLFASGGERLSAGEDRPALIYHNDFSQHAAGELGDGLLVLEGNFTIEKSADESYLSLSPVPLIDSSVQMGKALSADALIQVRVKAHKKGRRQPRFGVGLHGLSGFQLVVVPSSRKVELKQGRRLVQSAAFQWRSGEWYFLELSVLKNGDSWSVSGRVWAQSASRPAEAQIEYIADVKLMKGRAYVSGMPLSGTPICYDDIEIRGEK